MIKIAVCDDEKKFLKQITDFLGIYMEKRGILYEIDTFSSGKEIVELGIDIVKYKIIFLDIHMDGMNGIKTAKKIREVSRDLYLVFITAYVDYTLEGYKVDAVRYILKNPVNLAESIVECLDAIHRKMGYKALWKKFDFQEGNIKVPLERLLYVESRLHKLVFYVMEETLKEYTLYDTLNKMESELAGNGFVRVHQSFLVNMRYIKEISRYKILLLNGMQFPVPRIRYYDVVEQYIAYKGEV